MKLKYYLRGLGIGILTTTVILSLAGIGRKNMTDEEVVKRAKELGMVESTLLSDLPDQTKAEEVRPTEPETPEPETPEPETSLQPETSEQEISAEPARGRKHQSRKHWSRRSARSRKSRLPHRKHLWLRKKHRSARRTEIRILPPGKQLPW